MANQENDENSKVAQTVRFESPVHSAITKIAADESRPSVANTVEWLIKTHPRVKKQLEAAETAGAGA